MLCEICEVQPLIIRRQVTTGMNNPLFNMRQLFHRREPC